jgi:hypothetical protein
MSEPSISPEERQSRIERSRVVLGIGVFLLVLGTVCLFVVGQRTGIVLLILGSIVGSYWLAFPYSRSVEVSPERFRADMSDPKGGVDEIATGPADPRETKRQPGRIRRILRQRPRSRGSEQD